MTTLHLLAYYRQSVSVPSFGMLHSHNIETVSSRVICLQFIDLGRVSSIEYNHKPVLKAARGQDVCIKIDPIPGEAPKMFGRHFDHTDLLVSKVAKLVS